jgi:hypothetical protein
VHGAEEAVKGVEGPDLEAPCGGVRGAQRVGNAVGNGVATGFRRDDARDRRRAITVIGEGEVAWQPGRGAAQVPTVVLGR